MYIYIHIIYIYIYNTYVYLKYFHQLSSDNNSNFIALWLFYWAKMTKYSLSIRKDFIFFA